MTTPTLTDDVQQAYEDALDDVHTRFVLNLPEEELASPDRIFFQLEQAWWFYDDMICDHSSISLPRFKTLKPFAIKMFEISPILQPMRKDFDKLWQRFTLYKRTISTYGTILLNDACSKVVLCRVYNSPSWTFPAGKVNQNEPGTDAGARETYEETGFDPNCQLGLTAKLQTAGQVKWTTPIREEDGLVFTEGGKRRTCYVCHGVPDDFPFAPVARKEVSEVAWHDLDDIPKKSFAVLPFMGQLRRWIKNHKGGKRRSTPGKRRATPRKSRSRSRGSAREEENLVETGLASPGEDSGWSEEDMFAANEKLIGRKITYDGNPHHFESGFNGLDPHSFHVVGGGFMNSGISKLAPAPQQSKLQPLFRKSGSFEDPNDDFGLTPFFASEGETDVANEAQTTDTEQPSKQKKRKSKSPPRSPSTRGKEPEANAGQRLLSMLQAKPTIQDAGASPEAAPIFLTDSQITERSQKEKITTLPAINRDREGAVNEGTGSAHDWITGWVRSRPEVPATERFGDFRFDTSKILLAMNNL